MDPISSAIITAISVGAISGLTEASKTAITDAYTRFKALLKQNFGEQSDVVQAVEQLEAKPDSAGRKAILQEEVTTVKADQDDDLLHIAHEIQQALQSGTASGSHSQIATGNYVAQADRRDHSKTGAGYTAFSSYDQFALQTEQSNSTRF